MVVDDGSDAEARRRLLEGAMHAGAALTAGMGLGHAMAQALGGRYGLPHGTMNAVSLPPALRYNEEVARAQIDSTVHGVRIGVSGYSFQSLPEGAVRLQAESQGERACKRVSWRSRWVWRSGCWR